MDIQEAIKIVDDLNDRAFEYAGCAGWHVSYAHDTIQVLLMDIQIWSSDEDEREEIGKCESCDGDGASFSTHEWAGTPMKLRELCSSCGGTGKAEPFEDLALFLPRRACEIAREILLGCEPKTDSEEPLPHDVAK